MRLKTLAPTDHQIVIFDIFGTLIKFGVQHHPFRQLLKWARENGRRVMLDDARTLMTINGDIDVISYGLGIKPPRELIQKIEAQIEDELSSLSLFDDVIPTLNALQSRGIRIGLCSNLAQPYGAVIGRLLAEFDLEQFLSYELGAIKSEAQIYKAILSRFNCEPNQCLFIGDTLEADYTGPIAVGMKALHLTRSAATQPHQISSLVDVLAYLDGGHR